MTSHLLAEFTYPDLEVSVLDVDCTGRYAFLAGPKQVAVIDLECPRDRVSCADVCDVHPSIVQCHPDDSSRIAIARRNTCEVYYWSANESRLSLEALLRGYIRPVNGVDWCPTQPNVLATASSEQFRSICIWDLRDPARLVRNIELFTATSLIRWNPFRDNHFATASDSTVQFWDLRNNIPERNLVMQSSRVLSMTFSPSRDGEFAISTKDSSLSVWHFDDFDSPSLSANYKKVPMRQLRYTPNGSGIVSQPLRNRWINSGLILWRADTLTPLRLLPTLDEDTEAKTSTGYQPESQIRDESWVLGFGWCKVEFSALHGTTFDFDSKQNLRTLAKPVNIVSWSADQCLKVHSLPASFLHIEDQQQPEENRPTGNAASVADDRSTMPVDTGLVLEKNIVSSKSSLPEQSALHTQKTSPAFHLVTQELSLLSSSMGQYKVKNVGMNGSFCTVTLVLYYCRRNHYHHHTICGFDADSINEGAFSRHRSDSLPIADLDALFQSTTVDVDSTTNARPRGVVIENSNHERSLYSIPIAGNVTLVGQFSPAYPAPHSPPMFEFSASEPAIHESILKRLLDVVQRAADETVATSRGCLEPCIRTAFKHLHSTTISFSPDEGSPQTNQGTLSSSDFYNAVEPDDESTVLPSPVNIKRPPPDASVPFPRTSGVRFSPSGYLVTFGLYQSLIETVQAAGSLPPRHMGTPRSFHDYLRLTGDKGRLFRKTADNHLSEQFIEPLGSVHETNEVRSHFPRSRSAETVVYCDAGPSKECIGDTQTSSKKISSMSLKSFDFPGHQIRQRHFSGKMPSVSRKTSDTARSKKMAHAGSSDQAAKFSQQRQSRVEFHADHFNLSNSTASDEDRVAGYGSPLAIIYDISSLTPFSKALAEQYSLDLSDLKGMCSHNLKAVSTANRPDLFQFWSQCTLLADARLKQPPLPGMIPPLASQSVGRSFFNEWLSHFLALGDAQSLTMLGFLMAAIDSQSTPSAVLLTTSVPFLMVHEQNRRSVTYNHHRYLGNPKSPLRRLHCKMPPSTANGDLKSGRCSRRTKSTVVAPNADFLEIAKGRKKHSLKRLSTNTAIVSHLTLQTSPGLKAERIQAHGEITEHTASSKRTRSNSFSFGHLGSLLSPRYPSRRSCDIKSLLALSKAELGSLQVQKNTTNNIAILARYFQEQILMDIDGPVEEDIASMNIAYDSHSWLFPFKYALQYTHFINVYANLLTAWGLVMPRTKFSMQWHKVLAWLHARSKPDFYTNLSAPLDQQPNDVLLTPSDWLPKQLPAAFAALSVPVIRTEVLNPLGISLPTSTAPLDQGGDVKQGDDCTLVCCVVCNVTTRGVIVACPFCTHGGHTEHISAWFVRKNQTEKRAVCPAPFCECSCGYLRNISTSKCHAAREGTVV